MNLEELKEMLKENGFILVDFKHFKRHDRILVTDGEVTIRLDLRTHLEKIPRSGLEWIFNKNKKNPQRFLTDFKVF